MWRTRRPSIVERMRIPPFTVFSLMRAPPPLPIRLLSDPPILNPLVDGIPKSLDIRPCTVLALSSALLLSGSDSAILPLTVCSVIEGVAPSRLKLASTCPLTVDNLASPARSLARTAPLTDEIFTSPATPLTSTAPFTASTADSRARLGTRKVYSTLAGSRRRSDSG